MMRGKFSSENSQLGTNRMHTDESCNETGAIQRGKYTERRERSISKLSLHTDRSNPVANILVASAHIEFYLQASIRSEQFNSENSELRMKKRNGVDKSFNKAGVIRSGNLRKTQNILSLNFHFNEAGETWFRKFPTTDEQDAHG